MISITKKNKKKERRRALKEMEDKLCSRFYYLKSMKFTLG